MNRLGFKGLIIISTLLLATWAFSWVVMVDRIQISQPAANEKEKVIHVLIRTSTESSALRKLAEPFEAQSGIKVEFVELGRDNYFTALGTQLFAGSKAFDILFMPNTSIAQFAAANAILPLNSFIGNPELTGEDFDMADFITAYRYQGDIYALPTDISTHFLYYRSDLIASPPETWSQFYETARQYTRALTPESPTRWGAAMSAVIPEERSKIFASLLWSFGGEFLNNEGQVKLDSEQSIQAGKYLRMLVEEKVVPSDLLAWDFAKTRDALLSGEVAMAAPFWNAAYQDILQSDSPYKEFIKIALIPGTRNADGIVGRTPLQHGWTLAINASSQNPIESWEFLKYATGKAGGEIYAEAGGVPARYSILSDPVFQESRPDFKLLLESVKTSRNEPDVTFYYEMVDIVERSLAKIVTLHSEPEAAFRSAADELRYLYQSIQINLASQSKGESK